jgi:hypothetical protein
MPALNVTISLLAIRGILRSFGLKVGVVTRKGFEGRIRELVSGHIALERIAQCPRRSLDR